MSSKFFFLIFALFFFQYGCGIEEFNEEIFCDVESVTNNKINSNIGKYSFKWVQQKTDEKSYSGKYSIKLYNGQPYGLSIKLSDILPDYYISANVKVHNYNSSCCIIIEGENAGEFLIKFNNKSTIDESGWVQLSGEAFIPASYKRNSIKLYVYNNDSNYAFFDDLKIKKSTYKKYPTYDTNETFSIEIDDSNFQKLQSYRINAFNEGLLQADNQKYVKMKMNYGCEKYKLDGRLKGDWLDHLLGDKWSFRLKVKKGKFWRGIRTFSIQSPHSRDFLNEWVAHKLFEKEDLLTTRFGFIPISINRKSKGVYAYEEHFDKQLLESKNRREGPIIKLDEEFFWAVEEEKVKTKKKFNPPSYYLSDAMPFISKETFKSKALSDQFLNGQILLNQFKEGTKKASEVFDVVKMAKAYAIYDLTRFYHGLAWHNLRFYYNPILCKLEIISYDGYTENGAFDWVEKPYIGKIICNEVTKPHNVFILQCFNDSAFVHNYYKYLEIYSSEEYVNKFFTDIDDELKKNENLIKSEFESYKYDYNFIRENAKRIREGLKNEKKTVWNIPKRGILVWDSVVEKRFQPYMIKAFTEDTTKNSIKVKLMNYLPNNVYVTGVETKKEKRIEYKKTFLNKLENNQAKDIYIEIPKDSKRIIIDNEIFVDIKKWKSPAEKTSRDIYIENSNYKKYFITKGNDLIYRQNIKVIDKLIYIPTGKVVIFNAGTTIDIIKSAGFVSCSPVNMNGLSNNPIIIKSTDKTANGFTVLQANEKSVLSNVTFEGLNTLDYKGWTLTGAVNFYESDVEITNTSFINNVCEDGLNIIRSKFIVKDSNFENTFGDAFDSDFSTGIVDGCKFENTNNDAIDFSGSYVTINNCEMRKIADKAVSGGEKSKLEINNIFIDGAKFGIVSKDLSILNVDIANVNNCQCGILQLVKKQEYGPSTINSTNVKLNNCNQQYLIEKKCILNLNNQKIEGTVKKLTDEFYK